MLINCAVTFVILGVTATFVKGDSNTDMQQACNSWENLKQDVENMDLMKLACTVNNKCTGISCRGIAGGDEASIEVHVENCVKPVGLLVAVVVPKYDLKWTQIFLHDEKFSIQNRYGIGGNGQLKMIMKQQDQTTVIVGLSGVRKDGSLLTFIRGHTIKLAPCTDTLSPSPPLNYRPQDGTAPLLNTNKRRFSAVSVEQENESKVVLGTVTTDGKSCDLRSLNICGEGETCVQTVVGSHEGVCNCLASYHRNEQGNCEANPTVPSTNVDPTEKPHQSDDGSISALQIAIPVIVVVILLTTLALVAYRFRWINRLRARLRQPRTYEEMVIEGDDNNDIQSHSMGNPVA